MLQPLIGDPLGIPQSCSQVRVAHLHLNFSQISTEPEGRINIGVPELVGREAVFKKSQGGAILLKLLFNSPGGNTVPAPVVSQEEVRLLTIGQFNLLSELEPEAQIGPCSLADDHEPLALAFGIAHKNPAPVKVNILNQDVASLPEPQAAIKEQAKKGQIPNLPPAVKGWLPLGLTRRKDPFNFFFQMVKKTFEGFGCGCSGQIIGIPGWGQILKGIFVDKLLLKEPNREHLDHIVVNVSGAFSVVGLIVVDEPHHGLKSRGPFRANSSVGGQGFAVKNLGIVIKRCLSQEESLNSFLENVWRLLTVKGFNKT